MQVQSSSSKAIVYFDTKEEERLATISSLFSVTISEDIIETRECCFDAVLQACDNNDPRLEQHKSLIIPLKDNNGRSIFAHCVVMGDKKRLGVVVERGLVPEEEADYGVHLAVRAGNSTLIHFLGKEGFGDFNSQPDVSLPTPLILAIEIEDVECIKVLVVCNVNHTTGYIRKENGIYFTPLSLTVYLGKIKAFDTLIACKKELRKEISYAWIEHMGNFLHTALIGGQFEMLDHLLTHYYEEVKDIINAFDPERRTPLMVAAAYGDVRAGQRLIQAQAALELGDNNGKTALHFAAENGHVDFVKLLLANGASSNALDNDQNPPSHYTTQKRLKNILKNRISTEKNAFSSRIQFIDTSPTGIIWQGGGNKSLPFLGVIEGLFESGKLEECKRFGGTSAGGFVSAFLSIGLNYEKIKAILDSNLMVRALFNLKTNAPISGSRFLDKLVEDISTATLTTLKIVLCLFGRTTGISDGKALRQFMNDLIELNTGIANCTFGEFASLVNSGKKNPHTHQPYRHLSVVATNVRGEPSLLVISSEDDQWKDFLVGDAVIGSGAYPFLLTIQTLRKKLGDEIIDTDYDCTDGGFLLNYPIGIFDKRKFFYPGLEEKEKNYPLFNRRTLGISLYDPSEKRPPNKKIRNIYSFFSCIFSDIYMSSEAMNKSLVSQNQERTLCISTNKIGTTEFKTTSKTEKGKRAIDDAKIETLKFFQE